jgi:hypothetical protein
MCTRTLLLPSFSSLVTLHIHVRGLNRMHFTETYPVWYLTFKRNYGQPQIAAYLGRPYATAHLSRE